MQLGWSMFAPFSVRGKNRLLCTQAPGHPGQEQVQHTQVQDDRSLLKPRHRLPGGFGSRVQVLLLR